MDEGILILSFPLSSSMGGGERYTETMVSGLAARGARFTLVSSSRALLSVFRKRGWNAHAAFGGFEPTTHLNVVLFLLTAPVFMLVQTVVLLWFRFAKKYRTVICLSPTDKLIATSLADALKMRVIWMEHLIPGRAIRRNPFRPLLVRNARMAAVVTVSEAAKAALVEVGYPADRIRIIPPSTPLPSPAPGPNAAQVVGCVARLHAEKGVMTLVDAFTEVAKRVPDAKLEIYGDGPERDLLERTVAMRKLGGRIVFHGWKDSRSGLYRDFRLLAVPSRKESFGMAALEAMAYGLPVVGTEVGGLPEVIEDKVTGLLVPAGDADALAEALIRLLEDPGLCRRFGEAGRARAEARFTEDRFLFSWHALLNG